MNPVVVAQRRALEDLLGELRSVVVAYSGGVDSTLVAALAHERLGPRSLAVTAVSPAVSKYEIDQAVSVASARGWNHLTLETSEIEDESYARNDPDRCYWCKTELFSVLTPLAERRRARVVTGTNLDDLGDHRPGLRAAAESHVRAPLAEVGLTKADVRALSRALGLPTAEKPASPCLASRFAYGVRVTPEGLRRIERAEEIVRAYGFVEFRVRDHGDLARIEVTAAEIERAAGLHDELSDRLAELGFAYITLDLGGFRSGSLNARLERPTMRRSNG